MIKHFHITVTGVVQGVGFRPFVYRVAKNLGLKGSVSNTATGVKIHIEGPKERIDKFLESLEQKPPPLAKVENIIAKELELAGFETFEIISSDDKNEKVTSVSPDVTLCEACLNEMRDPSNRRYRYPFINCTDCGPRYTITKTVPYDRPNTSMAKFEMCPDCKKEYEDPMNRRYHAQPISCWNCGPKLSLLNNSGNILECDDPIKESAKRLKNGEIVAVKGLGGFHLMCNACDENSVQLLRERKRRPSKPLAIMVKGVKEAKILADFSEIEKEWLTSKERPIVLLKKREGSNLAPSVAPNIDRIGVMLPYTPLHELLFDYIDFPLVATSANLSDEPIIRDSKELIEKLGSVVDAVLDHDRDIVNACDDSVMQVAGSQPLWLRVARGIAPLTFSLKKPIERKIVAVGANQKSTIALGFSDRIVLSPHIGDLNTIEAMDYFERTINTFKNFYDFTPDTIVHDKHPGYETTKWAKEQNSKSKDLGILEVQHHYAHALGVMAEYGLYDEQVVAFCWDGTGYGDDGTIWGGEVMLADAKGFERIATISPFKLIGADRAVKEPRRVALSLLFEIFTLEEILALSLPTVKAFSSSEIKMLYKAWERGINSPKTSSMGRLFDAISSLCGICQRSGFEGESGMLIEAAATVPDAKPYSFNIEDGEIKWQNMVCEIVKNPDQETVASRFLATLIEIVFVIASKYPDKPLLFAGGVFQNRTLIEKILARCKKDGRKFYFPSKVSPNDGAVALGQVWYGINQYII
ncbi:carbamoyltransferase HypF [Hydrogenimonas thermophila]|uniref:Carbamoyltransferase n=1 Tax=Hydrogenimonas thermophila TaxID=223786 RepID=A0A1I5LPF4_9BACT|nr:carbamoyltransferase HypF [Hydrogenimonas thermophila]WOE69912.1 carbamoyltransferase HypF [Hydrogenimonas thermophila]WOE72427.1 carbamoyltransferase HypF [Hydrogenimonas thermophila]SFO98706.1 Hydrogenase maturation protein, carbamoyltransferase HypF [Hydrogenimonas thermophila]